MYEMVLRAMRFIDYDSVSNLLHLKFMWWEVLDPDNKENMFYALELLRQTLEKLCSGVDGVVGANFFVGPRNKKSFGVIIPVTNTAIRMMRKHNPELLSNFCYEYFHYRDSSKIC